MSTGRANTPERDRRETLPSQNSRTRQQHDGEFKSGKAGRKHKVAHLPQEIGEPLDGRLAS